jgi:hypothetical protein
VYCCVGYEYSSGGGYGGYGGGGGFDPMGDTAGGGGYMQQDDRGGKGSDKKVPCFIGWYVGDFLFVYTMNILVLPVER